MKKEKINKRKWTKRKRYKEKSETSKKMKK